MIRCRGLEGVREAVLPNIMAAAIPPCDDESNEVSLFSSSILPSRPFSIMTSEALRWNRDGTGQDGSSGLTMPMKGANLGASSDSISMMAVLWGLERMGWN